MFPFNALSLFYLMLIYVIFNAPQVHLPNLKWIDNHRPVFRVHLKMISSIYPQDLNLHDFLKKFYTLGHQLGIESEEKGLSNSIRQIEESSIEPTVQFLHLLLNNLCQLLVRPTPTADSGNITT